MSHRGASQSGRCQLPIPIKLRTERQAGESTNPPFRQALGILRRATSATELLCNREQCREIWGFLDHGIVWGEFQTDLKIGGKVGSTDLGPEETIKGSIPFRTLAARGTGPSGAPPLP